MMQRIIVSSYSFLFIFLSLCEVQAQDSQAFIKEEFIGNWKGEGRVIVAWCEQKHLPFELQIGTNGIVSGKIGDALIRNGKLRRNNFLLRWLGNTEFIIDAQLTNYIIEIEKIQRDSIRVFLDYDKPVFTGGFHTSGSKFGGKEKMILSGTGVKLVKKAR
jgi:hypothetical protein